MKLTAQQIKEVQELIKSKQDLIDQTQLEVLELKAAFDKEIFASTINQAHAEREALGVGTVDVENKLFEPKIPADIAETFLDMAKTGTSL